MTGVSGLRGIIHIYMTVDNGLAGFIHVCITGNSGYFRIMPSKRKMDCWTDPDIRSSAAH